MLEAFEHFCREHEKTIAFVEAFSTLAAVIISLALAILASRANKPRLKAWVDISRMVHSTIPPETRLRYLTATITNTGIVSLRVPVAFFNWQLPGQRNKTLWVNPLDASGDERVPKRIYPFEVLPKTSHPFIVSDIVTFHENFAEIIRAQNFIKRVLYRFVRVTIITDDGSRFRAKIDDNVRREMRRLNP